MTYDDILTQTEHATIEVDEEGFIVAINDRFSELLGYGPELVGEPLATIIPPVMQDSHHLGFSRFVVTGDPHIMARDVSLPTLHESGREVLLIHHIAATRTTDGQWRFVSMIREQG